MGSLIAAENFKLNKLAVAGTLGLEAVGSAIVINDHDGSWLPSDRQPQLTR